MTDCYVLLPGDPLVLSGEAEAGCIFCPAQASAPAHPASLQVTQLFGWQTGAVSVHGETFDCYTQFTLSQALGVFVGLCARTAAVTDPSSIDHGIYALALGPALLYTVVERGVQRIAPTARSADAVFRIERWNGEARYLVDGDVVYVSTASSAGRVHVGARLYASGDTVNSDIEFDALAEPSGNTAGGGQGHLVAAAPRAFGTDADNIGALRATPARIYGFDGGLRVTLVAPRARVFGTDAANAGLLVGRAAVIVGSDAPISVPSIAAGFLVAPAPGIFVQDKQRSFGDGELAAEAPRILGTDAPAIGVLRAQRPEIFGLDREPALVNFAYLVQSPGVMSVTSGIFIEDLADVVNLFAAGQSTPFLVLADQLGLGAALGSSMSSTESLSDELAMGDLLGVIWQAVASDALALGDALSTSSRQVVEMVDTLRLIAGAGSSLAATNAVASALAMSSSLGVLSIEQMTDQLSLGGELQEQIRATAALIDTLALADTPGAAALLSAAASDTLQLSDVAATTAALIEQLRDGLGLTCTLRVADTTYFAWVCNTETQAFTSYINYPFNSFCRIGNKYFGASDDGIFELAGDSDDGEPITSRVRTGLTNLGTGRHKRMPSLYLGYSSTGTLVLKAITTSPKGEKREDWYQLTPRPAGATREGRIKLGKGLKSVFWAFELVNVDGAKFTLEDLQLFPMLCDRRIG
jgi:hypothetical protein